MASSIEKLIQMSGWIAEWPFASCAQFLKDAVTSAQGYQVQVGEGEILGYVPMILAPQTPVNSNPLIA